MLLLHCSSPDVPLSVSFTLSLKLLLVLPPYLPSYLPPTEFPPTLSKVHKPKLLSSSKNHLLIYHLNLPSFLLCQFFHLTLINFESINVLIFLAHSE